VIRLKRAAAQLRNFLFSVDGSLRQKTLRSGIWVALSSLLLGSLSFIKAVVLARLLTPEHFGLMAICMVVMRALQVFTETGLSAALIQRPGEVDEAKHTVYTLTALRGLILAFIVLATSTWIATFYEQSTLKPLLDLLAVSLALGGMGSVNYVVAQKNLNFRPQFNLQQVLGLLDFVVTIVLAVWLRSVWALVIGHVVKTALSIPLSFLLLPGRLRFALNPQHARELLRYGKYISGIAIVVYTTTEIDNAVIGKVLGVEALGFYTLAYMLANLPATHLAKVVASVMFPAYSKLQHDSLALRKAFLSTVRIVATMAIPAAVGMAILAEELVVVVFGPKWAVAANVLPVLCVFGALRSVSAINGYVFNAIGKPYLSFYINLAKLVVIAATIIPATRMYGLIGAAVAITAPSLVMFLIGNVVFSRTLRIELGTMYSAILPATASSFAMGLALLLVKQWTTLNAPAMLVAAVAGGALLYGALNKSDIQATLKLLSLR
jgi:O-antigen/teichoic acid export membrane protein